MGQRLRNTLKITGWSFGGLFALVAAFVGLLAFPGFMFAHQLEYRNFTVYSDEDLRGRIEPILAGVDAQLSASEINDPSLAVRPVSSATTMRPSVRWTAPAGPSSRGSPESAASPQLRHRLAAAFQPRGHPRRTRPGARRAAAAGMARRVST